MAELFPADFLKQLEGLHLLARQISRGRMRAERRSLKRGSGLEFADYRPFTAGDDIRGIDWGVYARNRHLLLKLFEEEEDLHVHLILDSTRSMDWGEPSKFDQARRIVAGLAYLAIANLDRAGVVPLGADVPAPWTPSRGRAKFLRLLRYLETCPTNAGDYSLSEGMRLWLASKPRRGLAIWVTDLWGRDLEDAKSALDRLRYARQDVGVVQVRHPEELDVGELGEYELEEIEAGTTKQVIIDRGVATAYRERVAEYESGIAEYCRRYGIAHLEADATTSAVDVLRRSLHEGGFVR